MIDNITKFSWIGTRYDSNTNASWHDFRCDRATDRFPTMNKNIQALKVELFDQWMKSDIHPNNVKRSVFRLKDGNEMTKLDEAVVYSYNNFFLQQQKQKPAK
ncbi:unnamed protein product [Phytophthora lilii]|uniref:Unnamed protein product n=1 Tax=Phytophthora lilii TaxID=2077276 RepID=A0A9W6WVG0_9STRA|nr:unnamed protein product [Phytophthora lilii]